MLRFASLVLLALLLGACAASNSDIARIPHLPQEPVSRTTGTTCGLYEQASTQSEMLATISAGASVQVLDSSNAHFIRARMKQTDGKVLTGYMYKACLAGR
jgi:hypothetical protein